MPGGGQSDAYRTALINAIVQALQSEGVNISFAQAEKALNWAYGKDFQGQDAINAAVKRLSGGGGGGGQDDLPPISGTGGGGGSGGGSGGSSGPSGPDPAVLRSNYLELLRRWGLSPKDKGLDNLVEHAVGATWSSTQFMQAVRKTKAYQEQFAGIQWRNGMSEGQYLATYASYKGMAQDIGVKLSHDQFGLLLKKGVDSREWAFRLRGLESLNKNKALLDWYEKVLKARGELKPKEQLSTKERFDIVTKQNSKKFEAVYQEAYLSYQLSNLGLTIGKGKKTDFSRHELNKLIKQVETGTPGFEVESLGAKDFAQLGATIRQNFPLSRLYKAGITERDLVEMELGGKRAVDIAKRLQDLQNTAKAATEDKVNAQFVQTGKNKAQLLYGGLGGEAGA